jgi:hypothetical protein
MKSNKKQLTLRIADLKEAIRRKYNSFKTGVVESERFLEKKYKPIIKEIKKSNTSPKQESLLTPKKEEKEEQVEKYEDYEPPTISTPMAERSELDTLLSTPSGKHSMSLFLNTHFENPTTRRFMEMFMKDRGGKLQKIDYTYGPRYVDGENLMVGDKNLEFDDDGSILIDNARYKGTEGLYELLFKRTPDKDVYDENDLKAYKDILNKTNAHKKGYTPDGQINRNSSLKYRGIISTLFPIKKGSGMQWKSSGSRDIIHWDDPNELVDRLRLLVLSSETGNNSHTNEILNIIEELREGGFIKGNGNARFQALLK